MTKPVRIRLSRAKGFNLQKASKAINGLAAVHVARPGKWGNPFDFRRSEHCWTALSYGCKGHRLGRQQASVIAFREWINPGKGRVTVKYERRTGLEAQGKTIPLSPAIDVGKAPSLAEIREQLAGKNLACWCKPGDPCHADVLLELANK